MPRRTKIPKEVKITIPKDNIDLYERPILELLFSHIEAKIAERIIQHIKENGRLWPDEWREIVNPNDYAETKNFYRTRNKMLALGLLKRGKENSLILSDELARKLIIMAEKVHALIRGAGPKE